MPYTGGIEGVLSEVAPRLVSQGYDVTVYVRSRYAGRPFKSWTYEQVRLVSLPSLHGKHLEATSHTFLSVLHALLTGADVFFFHAVVLGFFTFIPKFFRKRVVVETHGLDWKREKWGWLARRLIKLSAYLCAIVPDATACVSMTDARFFKQEYGKQFPVIMNGVNAPVLDVDQDCITKFRLCDRKYVLFMSRLVPEKGCHLLIEAWSSLDPQIRGDLKLAIAGDVSYRDKYYYTLKRQARDDVVFLGFVSGRTKAQLLTHGLVFVQPSTIEGLPLALLEAMSYGLYPLVSDIEENLDTVRSCHGTSFRAGDSGDLSNKLAVLLANPEKLDQLRPEISRWILRHYNWDDVTQRLVSVLGGKW